MRLADKIRDAFKRTGKCAFYGTKAQVEPIEIYLRRLQSRFGGYVYSDNTFNQYEVSWRVESDK